ncbi:MAG: GFA family protein, partial [Leucothrix sp.]
MSKIIKGSCLCGSVSYTASGEMRPICACHCTQCRKFSGHFTTSTSSDKKDLSISNADNTLTWYKTDSASWGFCNRCGSSLFFQPDDNNKRTSIFAGSIDGDSGLTLSAQMYCESKGDYY